MSKYIIKHTKVFKRQLKKFKNDRKTLDEIENVVDKLANDEKLKARYSDHQLSGNLKELRECHIKPNLLLVYDKQKDALILTCMSLGSHSEAFKK